MKYSRIASLLFVCVFFITSCTRGDTVEKQIDFHDSIGEIESYVLTCVGDYICFQDPVIEGEKAEITALFLTDYIGDESKLSNHPLIEVMGETRVLFNEFLLDNPDYYLNDYFIVIQFQIAPGRTSLGNSDHYETVGAIYNDVSNGNSLLCSVDFRSLLNSDNIDTINCSGIECIFLNDYNVGDADDIMLIVEKMPDIKKVYVLPEYIDTLSARRTDISFVV